MIKMIVHTMHARRKKQALLKIVARSISGASALTTYIFTPTGGVIAPMVVTMVMIIEYQIGSKPNAFPNGKKMGIVRTKNPSASIKQPPIR